MLGHTYQVNPTFMKNVFGFTKDGVHKMSNDFTARHFWEFLTDLPPTFDAKKGSAIFIKYHKYWLLHKMLACLIFGKSEGNRVSIQELFLIWCVLEKKPICWPHWILNQMFDCSNHSTSPLTHDHVITQIALAFNVSQSLLSSMRCVRLIHFTKQAFTYGEVIDTNFNLKHA